MHLFKWTIVFAAIVNAVLALGARADEWEKVGDLDLPPLAFMGEGQTGISYSRFTYRFYVETTVDLLEDQRVTLTVTSKDYQPVVQVRDASGTIIAYGTFQTSKAKEKSPTLRTVLEFQPEDRGTFRIMVTTKNEQDRGFYSLNGSIWAPERVAEIEAPGVSDGGFLTALAGVPLSKSWGPNNYGTHHAKGAEYWDDTLKEFSGQMEVNWLEPGDTATDLTLKLPEWARAPWNVAKQEDNVTYLAPIDYGGRAHPVVLLGRNGTSAVVILVYDSHVAELPTIVDAGRLALAEAERLAR